MDPEPGMALRETQLVVSPSISIPMTELELFAVRSSGPGGQNVNKVSSKIQLRWDLSSSTALPEETLQRFRSLQRRRISKDDIFQLGSQRYRDQEKNRLDCFERLKELILQATFVPKARKKTKVPRGVKEGRLRDKKSRSVVKQNRKAPAFEG